jgi:RNA polymerase sigma-70 factor (ECF subfamily)
MSERHRLDASAGDRARLLRDATLADAVELALVQALQTLGEPEQLAFVMREMFGCSYGEIGAVLGRPAPLAGQLVARARSRVWQQVEPRR